jgi:hypothetical protein
MSDIVEELNGYLDDLHAGELEMGLTDLHDLFQRVRNEIVSLRELVNQDSRSIVELVEALKEKDSQLRST